jgi:hypothetical protein
MPSSEKRRRRPQVHVVLQHSSCNVKEENPSAVKGVVEGVHP